MKIGCDLDGVLADFVTSFSHLFMEMFPHVKLPVGQPDYPPCWDFPQFYGGTAGEQHAALVASRMSIDFWAKLPPLENAWDDIWELSKLAGKGHEVYFITDRKGVDVKGQTERWLRRFGYVIPTVLISANKHAVYSGLNLDVMIDDKPENLRGAAVPGLFLFNNPWNRSCEDFTRVYSVRNALSKAGGLDGE